MRIRLQSEIRNLKVAIPWLVVGLPIVALLLRFGMRALGVRTDVPLPGFVYWATAPLVEPFNRFFPANPRFDTTVAEVASLAAAGAIFGVAAGVYIVLLLLFSLLRPSGVESTYLC